MPHVHIGLPALKKLYLYEIEAPTAQLDSLREKDVHLFLKPGRAHGRRR